jgi:hypothetical protein
MNSGSAKGGTGYNTVHGLIASRRPKSVDGRALCCSAAWTQSWALSPPLKLLNSGHSFIGFRSPCNAAEMAKIETNLPIDNHVGNDR